MTRLRLLAGLWAVAILAGVSRGGAEPQLIDNVHVVDVRAGAVVEGRAVYVRDGVIAAVFEAGRTPPEGARVIDAGGAYLIPGLIDSHVHFITPEVYGPALLAHGVVLVRDMGGATESVLSLRDELNAGERLGPRMIATGAIVDGDPPVWAFSEACGTPEEARAAVNRLADAGVDLIKVYSKLDRETYLAAVGEAARLGLMAVGHVPESVTIEEAAGAGQRTAEHLMGVPSVVLPAHTPDENDRIGARDRWDLIPDVDPTMVGERLAALADTGIVHCPTLVVYEGIARSDDEDRVQDERMAYVPGAMRSFWEQPGYKAYARSLEGRVPIMIDFVGRMHRAGVPLIVGTDLANPYVFPGFSLHREMELFAGSGIPPAEVLRMATLAPAELFGVADRFGSIERGREASFVLLASNPLEDLSALGRIEGVWLGGEHHDRAGLDEMLARARRAASGETAEAAPEGVKGVEIEGERVREGRLVFTFGQWDAGHESFVLTRTDGGYALYAEFRPLGGMQQPSVSVYELDTDFRVRRARYRQLSGDTTESMYEVGDGVVVAVRGDERQEFELPEGAVFTGPNNIADIIVTRALALEEGESRTYQSASFGVPGWRVRTIPVEVTRVADERVDRDGAPVEARVFESVFTVEGGTFSTRSWVDAQGLLLRAEMTMPFGKLTMELEE